jgi:predicted ribonuclease YlaK
MRKKYILDTSVLIHDPQSFKSFHNSDVILPITVLDELDKLKKSPGEVGKNARVTIKLLDEICNQAPDINAGLLLDHDILFSIDAAPYEITNEVMYGDNRILACGQSIGKNCSEDVILVSNDINMRVRARALGLMAEGYEANTAMVSDLYPGIQYIKDEVAGNDLISTGVICPSDYGYQFHPNECVVFQDEEGNEMAKGRQINLDYMRIIKRFYPWSLSPRNIEQEFAIELIMDPKVPLVTLIGRAGTGKSLITLAAALELVLEKRQYNKFIIYRPIQPVGNDIGFLPGPQPLDAKVLTPTGWTTMGELKMGSTVISRDGKPTKVIGIYPKGTKSVYKVNTNIGSTECCEDHLWLTRTSRNKRLTSIKTTREIMDTLQDQHHLPRNEAVQFTGNELPLSPYTFGALLGDGSLASKITLYNTDDDIIKRVNDEVKSLGYVLHKNNKMSYDVVSVLSDYNNRPGRQVRTVNMVTNEINSYPSMVMASKSIGVGTGGIYKRCNKNQIIANIRYEFTNSNRYENAIKNIFYELELLNIIDEAKFIPAIYKYSSIEDRIELLRGLMDTDGTIKENGEASFCTTSKRLALDVIELVKTLGGRANLHSRNRIGKSNIYNGAEIICRKISYEFTISLPGTINPFYMKRKAKMHKPERGLSPVTIKSIEYIGEKEVQCILVENPEHLYITDDFIVTHNTMEEKLTPWFQAVMDNFEVLFTSHSGDKWRTNFEMARRKDKIQMEAITYIRGRSIPNAIILIDESQNLTKDEVKTILTRAGENTKIILTGDLEQIDHANLDATNNGLAYVIDKFKDSKLAGHITFTHGERSELASHAASVL